MSNKLYVGNLAFSINDDLLKQVFTAAGNVQSAKVIIDRQTGKSKGFGFVEMSTEEEAQNAIATLNGSEQQGRSISVAIAREQAPREGGGGGGGGYRGGGGGGGGYRGGGGGGGRGGGGGGYRGGGGGGGRGGGGRGGRNGGNGGGGGGDRW